MSISVLAGLGNPGSEYQATRHNIGFVVLDALAAANGLSWTKDRETSSMLARWQHPQAGTVILAKPLLFMNESGWSLRRLCDYYRKPPSALVAVYDDLTIDVARLKLSVGGSAGGHNGVQSLIEHLGSEFVRFRVGIGPKTPREIDLKDFVLGKIPPADLQLFQSQLTHYTSGLELLVTEGLERAMNQLNRRSPKSNEPDNNP